MYILGITGNFGSGKTEVAQILKTKYKAKIIDVDKIGHQILKKNFVVKNKLIKNFGQKILNFKKEIDRKKLAHIVFKSLKKLKILNKIVHPSLRRETKKIINKFKSKDKNKGIVVVDCALLFELGLDKEIDRIWLVKSSLKSAYQRLRHQGFSYADIWQRRRYQVGGRKNKRKAVLVIENEKDKDSLVRLVDAIIRNSGHLDTLKPFMLV